MSRIIAGRAGKATGLRIALISGNYNMVRDGANKALNRLVQYLLDNGAEVRIYSPTIAHPAFEPAGELISVPSVAIPGRSEYRFATGLPKRVRDDIKAFNPNVIHLSVPDLLANKAQKLGRELGIPVIASLHTLFETYLDYYGFGMFRGMGERYLARFYGRCDYVLAPNEVLAEDMRRTTGLGDHVRIWSRGVDADAWNPRHRSLAWRRAKGYADDEPVVLFFGRVVKEKGLDVFEAVVKRLREKGHKVRPLIVGSGPAESEFAASMGDAVFTGHVEGDELATAVASADILVNPSSTEAFGNVNLEAMAAGVALVSAAAPAARALIQHGESGMLVPARDVEAYVEAVETLIADPARREAITAAAMEASHAYRWSAILDRVIDTYRLAVTEGPRDHGAKERRPALTAATA